MSYQIGPTAEEAIVTYPVPPL